MVSFDFDDDLIVVIIDDRVCIRDDVIRTFNRIILAVKFTRPFEMTHSSPDADHVVLDFDAVLPPFDFRNHSFIAVRSCLRFRRVQFPASDPWGLSVPRDGEEHAKNDSRYHSSETL